ncbi:MAG: hypothetical protein RLO01_05690 [Thalassobaculaceae bacterium]
MSRPGSGKDPFFVGYAPTPRALIGFLALVAGALIGTGVAAAAVFALAQGDWGAASFKWGDGYQTRTGVLAAAPYPVLYVPPSPDYPQGRAVVLSGQGKRGVRQVAADLDGRPADVGGIALGRDEVGVEFIQVGGEVKLRQAEDTSPVPAGWTPPVEDLGPRTLKGEIVDSKCYLGAMRPGQGKTHKLCANLCLIGDIPPMFVVYREEGAPLVMLLGDAEGGPIPDDLLDHTSHFIEISGQLERRADLLVLRIDPDSVRRL